MAGIVGQRIFSVQRNNSAAIEGEADASPTGSIRQK
jgi:hypothetical protein